MSLSPLFAVAQVSPWHWAGFVGCILFFLALDLGVFHRKAHVVGFKEALAWTSVWVTLSFCFGLFISPAIVEGWTRTETVEFITGYVIELSLSMDNVFVIALIFTYFRVPPQYQHRVLFWGILGALIMRGVMILAGAALISKFMWTLYIFGAFLVFTGIKMLFVGDEGVHPDKNPVIRLAKRMFSVTNEFHGQKFTVRDGGRLFLTPLALVLVMVETTDLIFAVDSIPAIFAITQKPFIVFTSNVFAILGLRSMYFLLAGAIGYFRYLKIGLSFVLVFIGIKMLIDPHGHEPQKWFQADIPASVSLLVVAAILITSIALSIAAGRRERAVASENDRKTRL
ncbi:MAG TPA: TerC family protein [Verrucomicrobiota bacterium]|nr:TerC family protein [Verrucomicrobiota bacterium]